MSLSILDCTLRDGGHHTKWSFSTLFVLRYLNALSRSGVQWAELGYRRPESIHGPWNQCSEELLNSIDLPNSLKYALMIDLKDFIGIELNQFFIPKAQSKVSMVRIAAHYHHIDHLGEVSQQLQDLGYIIAVNLMRSGQVDEGILSDTLTKIENNDSISLVNFADSFGSMNEDKVHRLISTAKTITNKPLGFHAHDNKQLALRNTLKAIELGVQSVDATISGMGKGPGNTAMEYLLVELQKNNHTQYQNTYDVQALVSILKDDFYPLKKELGWGSDLFSYLAAERSIHPDDIDDLRKNL